MLRKAKKKNGAENVKSAGEREIEYILSRLTLEEKASLCSGLNDHFTKPVERLGIPSVEVSDGPHGLRHQIGDDALARGKGTCFPADVAVASSWNPEVAWKIGEAIGKECMAEDVAVILGPAMNIKRTPVCGRNFEYYSEDPFLSGKIAARYVKGVQSRGVGACLKHFAANNQETLRMSIDAKVGERALREIYLKGFEIAVKEAKPMCIMAAYNKINGVYCTENKRLLTDIARGEWGFDGIVMSDWGAVYRRENAAAAGLDLEMPSSYGYGDGRLVKAVKKGTLDEKTLDGIVKRMLQFVFTAHENLHGGKFAKEPVDFEAQHTFAREAAEECIVLLKNRDGILPLQPSLNGKKKLAVIGGMAKYPRYQGGGSSNVNVRQFDVPFEEIAKRAACSYEISYACGYDTEEVQPFFTLRLPSSPSNVPNEALIDEAVLCAQDADLALIFVGLPEATESEGIDRRDMRLPLGQEKMLQAVLATQPNAVVLLNNGSPVEMPWIDQAKAVVESYVGGQGGAYALARILFGEVSPSGKLAETFATRYCDTPGVKAFASDTFATVYGEGIMTGYRYYDSKGVEPLFPFGHGLSYTEFMYSNLQLSKREMYDDETVSVGVNVTNTGGMAAAEIVQFYVSFPSSRILRAKNELKGFGKVFLQPGETKTVSVMLDRDSFARYDEAASAWLVDEGEYEIKAAASSRDVRFTERLSVTNRVPRYPVFDLNTSIGEIASYPDARDALVRFVKPFIRSSFLSQMPGADEEIANQLITRFEDMPLRSLALTGSQLPTKAIEQLTTLLNRAAKGRKGIGLLFN